MSWHFDHTSDNLDYDDDKTLGESGRGRFGEVECGGEEGRGTLL